MPALRGRLSQGTNMKRLICLAIALVLSGCGDRVPTVTDYKQIVVDGKPMTHAEFLNKYCADAPTNETCIRVGKAMREGATKGKPVKGW